MSNLTPMISCIIPTYRRSMLLTRAIKSVLNQTFSNIQICIYDNASGDETKEVVESFIKNDKRVKYFCHESNIGALKNFAFGFNRVDTPYFSFLSDDDLMFPDFYETAVNKLKEYPQAAFFSGKCAFIDKNNSIIDIRLKDSYDKLLMMNEAVENCVGRDFNPWTSILFNTEKVKKYKLETSIKLHDIDFLLRIMYDQPIYISSKLCGVYCWLPSSASFDFQAEDILPFVNIILPKLNLISTINAETHKRASQRIRGMVSTHIISLIYQAVKKGDFQELEKLKNILRENEGENIFLKKIYFYKMVRKYSTIWYPCLFFRRLLLNFLKFINRLKNYPIYEERKRVQKIVLELIKILDN
jgi:glycosyltransferase involved in cell wall biosynthesis